MRSSDPGDFDPQLEFAVLCDFLAGSSVGDLAREFHLSDSEIEKLLRTALFTYGFRSGA